jgi:Tol biopolymer transport system component
MKRREGTTMYKTVTTIVLATLLALPLLVAPAAEAAFRGANGKIAFGHSGRKSNDIWVVDPSSGSKQRLTRTPRANEAMPDWNATGTHIAYSKCSRDEFRNCDIWVMKADGSEKTRLTFTTQPEPFLPFVQETWPTWSPDGERIAYTSNAEDVFQDIWVMNADGTHQERLTVNVESFDAFPEWSPDGSKIAFTSDRDEVDDIWVMNVDGSDPVRLTSGKGIDERPDWSPDGARITFSRRGNIWVMNADGTELTKLTDTRRWDFGPAFSPNGNRIVLNRTGKDDRIGLWVMRANGSRPKQLTFGRFDFFPDWQPHSDG